MRETEWAKKVADALNVELSGKDNTLCVQAGVRLVYANEIREYTDSKPVYNEMKYETDILVFETKAGVLSKPRVVIETKIERITTHDAITYSQKAATHKYVHPYLRYGIFLGKREQDPLPGRLFRHGAQFDFMLSWEGYEPKDEEWGSLVDIVTAEMEASRNLEEMIFNSRRRDRQRYTVLHKPLLVR